MSLFDNKNIKFTEIEVENPDLEVYRDFANDQNLSEQETLVSVAEEVSPNEQKVPPRYQEIIPEVVPNNSKKKKEEKYNWAFFLASLFVGVGLSRIFHVQAFVMFGLAGGFLFFVDPIYDKVMEKIKNW